ncbi:MAG: DUF378 domain-containing protein [Lachnospiraceae bacterium]|nr:DUF378 domain-containing protein [Lachnospiraceae bacterium]
MKFLNILCLTIVVIGAINWGLIGFADWNIVSAIFGDATAFTRIVYGLVGLSGLYLISFYGLIGNERSYQ